MVYKIGHKFEHDIRTGYTLWPMEFSSYDDAEEWIQENYPPGEQSTTQWVIVQEEKLH